MRAYDQEWKSIYFVCRGCCIIFFEKYRDETYISQLKEFIEAKYGLGIHNIAAAKRGYHGETWKIDTECDTYFAKLVYLGPHKSRYMNSFAIVEHMNQNGIDFISKIKKTIDEQLYSIFNDGVVGVFHYVEGEHTEDYPLSDLFHKLAHIYKVPVQNVQIIEENFNINYMDEYYRNLTKLKIASSPSVLEAVRLLEGNSRIIEHYADRLMQFADKNKNDLTHFHITSGDVGGNVIIQGEQFTIIDWDHLMLAPIERDIWPYLHDEKQIILLNEILELEGLHYKVSQDRLAFYCYLSFFYYLHEYMSGLLEFDDEAVREAIANDIKSYLNVNCWIYGNLNKVDQYRKEV
ncbi:aminoglycoside phosphotransferase family protein [Paenibacillus radicis (ex Xue et al. 2023)]|uniref:Aminoglycoside phosphotransferase family protein n=1 Tax=Paenibacillus radicis (ex Xue et al. 2023) TaxID=2972489 RepID=A0ABT1YD71_9BACL|nr:aminoglycoside phosphotransferase family protein [Paenibacillus radicis (ex Xue et al. 2023)]MCR8630163.1 aminoglycoside phosphotransferase family protein [Paenibacillus radicis (ex Xue et al. 2023)]